MTDRRKFGAGAGLIACKKLVKAAKTKGVTTAVIRAQMGISQQATSERLNNLSKAGKIIGVAWIDGKRDKTWFTAENVPAVLPAPRVPGASRSTAPRIRADQTAIIPAGVKIQLCPPCQLDRYRVDPAIAGRGVISQDYFARRQA